MAPEISGFDRRRRSVGLFAGPLVFLAILILPSGMPPEAQRLAAIFGLVIVFWVTEAIPLAATALLGPALSVPLGVAGATEAFASFGHPIIFLFLGSFLISTAMTTHGLDRRIALFVLSRPWIGDRPGRILFAFGGIAWLLSMWMSNTATTAMMLPIGLGVLHTMATGDEDPGGRARRGYGTALMLMIAFSCNIGGIATPIGTPPNLIAIGLIDRILGIELSFFDWMRFALPISAVLFFLLLLVIYRMHRIGGVRLAGVSKVIRARRAELGPLAPGERVALLAFLVAVTLWTLPGLAGLALGPEAAAAGTIKRALPEGASAVLAASLLFLLPIDWKSRRFAMDWSQATRIDWGTILLFGGGLSLGSLAFSSGLAEALGQGVRGAAGALPLWLVVLLAVLAGDLMTEFMSNTATANLLIPIFLALVAAAGVESGLLLPALGATLGCSLAFCLPVATPPNAIVYGSGQVALTEMIRVGVVLDLGCAVVTWLLLLALPG